jgi:hypothetical protein
MWTFIVAQALAGTVSLLVEWFAPAHARLVIVAFDLLTVLVIVCLTLIALSDERPKRRARHRKSPRG